MGALGDGVKEVDWINSRKSVRQYLVMNWIWPGRKEGKHGGQGVQGGFQRRHCAFKDEEDSAPQGRRTRTLGHWRCLRGLELGKASMGWGPWVDPAVGGGVSPRDKWESGWEGWVDPDRRALGPQLGS